MTLDHSGPNKGAASFWQGDVLLPQGALRQIS